MRALLALLSAVFAAASSAAAGAGDSALVTLKGTDFEGGANGLYGSTQHAVDDVNYVYAKPTGPHSTMRAEFELARLLREPVYLYLTACDDDPTRVLIRQVLGAVSQFDKSVTVLKLRAARERVKRRNGRCEGRKPYGTRPGEHTVLQRIQELRRKPRGENRLSVAKIAEILNREGHPTRTGKPPSAAC